ncbi:MAG: phospholipase [Actinomycetota bacterium]|nr:phospholipase [Actinomycetota bacterium]
MSDTSFRQGRLGTYPAAAPTRPPFERGFTTLRLDGGLPAELYVPPLDGGRRLRLVVVLHGAGGSAGQAAGLLLPFADEAGLVLLAPKSVAPTWDVITGGFGPDVARLDAALAEVFDRLPIAAGDVAVSGFSDGASYALSLGLTNGELFSAVLAFSPGFLAPGPASGSPRIFVSHGVHDAVLPIDRCSRRLVPALQRAGYDVTYREFDGPHVVPPEIADEAVGWLVGRSVTLPAGTPEQQPGR